MRLNIGCGTDIKEGYINLDRFKYPGIEIRFDFNKYPWKKVKTRYFDEIYASHIIEHIERPELFLKECCRILKDKGMIENANGENKIILDSKLFFCAIRKLVDKFNKKHPEIKLSI